MLFPRLAEDNRHTTLSLLVSSISQRPGQPYHDNQSENFAPMGSGADVNRSNGTAVNGENAISGEGWADTLKREMVNRCTTSALCSW